MIAPSRVVAAASEMRAEERTDSPTPPDLYSTRAMLGSLSPREWEHIAVTLNGVLSRAPVKDGEGYAAERMLLGALAWELRMGAHAAGEPVGLQADLRAATTRVAARRIELAIESERQLFHDHISSVLRSGIEDQSDAVPA